MNLIVLIVSFVIVALMLVLKIWENRFARETFVTRFISKGDDHIVALFMKSRRIFRLYRERTIFWALVEVPGHIERFFAKLKRRSMKRYTSLSGKMRGERVLGQNSAATVSPFMRTLTKQK